MRERLHIVLAFSPIGNAFRTRCRMFPSLVNCCTIDWFSAWPEDALFSVAESFLSKAGADLGTSPRRVSPCPSVCECVRLWECGSGCVCNCAIVQVLGVCAQASRTS